ncbi:MAG: tetratricopeptide repeat protein [Gemmatimonadota bacterium]|nr:MAG: tetratricopeptide repeat protein [Gemmatimonadota bacterium]
MRNFEVLFPVVLGAALATSACAGRHTASISPDEIPQLEQQLAQDPGDGAVLLRYAAALFAGGRYDSARTIARRGMAIRPDDALGPLVVGQTLERQGAYDRAIAVYADYLAAYPEHDGAAAVRARDLIARRARATEQARVALTREDELSQQPGDPQTVAVLPLDVAGDASYQPLSRGLAEMITSDLALLERFRLVERLEVGALLDEMRLAEAGRVDAATAARMGYLLRAGRMVQGLAAIPPDADARLEASVVRSDGQVTSPQAATGRLRDLMQMEKQVVIGLAGQLGYVLSEAERQMILENGTQSLVAFLAYSRGLVAEDLGDFPAAALYYGEAVRADPGFSAARANYQRSVAADAVTGAPDDQVTALSTQSVADPTLLPTPLADVMASTLGDIASTQAERNQPATRQQTTQQATTTTNASPPPTLIKETPAAQGTVRVIFRLP